MASELVSTGFQTTGMPTSFEPPSASAIVEDWPLTCSTMSGPYSPWLPVRNQTCPVLDGVPAPPGE